MSKGPFVTFVRIAQKPEKLTKVWSVLSVGGVLLGDVRWFSAWRRYCFFPGAKMVFDANCMWDIADFVSAMTEEQKHDQKTRRDAKQ